MPLDPMRGFETGYKVGSTGRKPLQGVLEDFETGMAEKRKFKHDVALEREKAKIKSEEEYGAFSKLLGDSGGQSSIESINKFQKSLGEGVSVKTPFGTVTGKGLGATQKDALADVQSNSQLLGTMKSLASSVGDIGNPLQAGAKSLFSKYWTGGRGGGGMTSKVDENLRLYNSMMGANAAGIYRSLTGDKRLSDLDAQARALPLLWQPGESEEVKQRKFSIIEQAFAERADRLQSGNFSEVSDPTKGTMHLTEDVYQKALSMLGSQDSVGSGGMESDRQQIQQAIQSGEYDQSAIESMKRDFQSEYGQPF